jgi:hypothetical protein
VEDVRPALPLVVVLCALPAAAAPGESSFALVAAYTAVDDQQTVAGRTVDTTGSGALAALELAHAVTDSVWLRGGLGAGVAALAGEARPVGVATAGITYTIDVLRYVPYVGLGGGVVLVNGHVGPALDLAVGIEVQESAGFGWGIEGRLEAFAGRQTVFFAGPRVAWKWGYF